MVWLQTAVQVRIECAPASRRLLRQVVRRHFEELGWLVVRARRGGGPFDLLAFPNGRTRWPRSLRNSSGAWVGIRISPLQPQGDFERGELRDLARAHGGATCFARYVPASEACRVRRIRLER